MYYHGAIVGEPSIDNLNENIDRAKLLRVSNELKKFCAGIGVDVSIDVTTDNARERAIFTFDYFPADIAMLANDFCRKIHKPLVATKENYLLRKARKWAAGEDEQSPLLKKREIASHLAEPANAPENSNSPVHVEGPNTLCVSFDQLGKFSAFLRTKPVTRKYHNPDMDI